MVRRDGAEIRRERIEYVTKSVLSLLHESGSDEIILSKILAQLEAETGNRRERLMEYLQNGHDRERFIIDKENDKIKKIAWADSSE